MPNWCQNRLTIYGTAQERAAVRESFKGFQAVACESQQIVLEPLAFSLDAICPMPDHLRVESDPRYKPAPPMTSDELLEAMAVSKSDTMPDWYIWRNHHWGTKWEVTEPVVSEEKSRLVVDFETAWIYPLPCLIALSLKFPTVKMKIAFYEPGCIGKGSATLLNGEVIRQTGVGVD